MTWPFRRKTAVSRVIRLNASPFCTMIVGEKTSAADMQLVSGKSNILDVLVHINDLKRQGEVIAVIPVSEVGDALDSLMA